MPCVLLVTEVMLVEWITAVHDLLFLAGKSEVKVSDIERGEGVYEYAAKTSKAREEKYGADSEWASTIKSSFVK